MGGLRSRLDRPVCSVEWHHTDLSVRVNPMSMKTSPVSAASPGAGQPGTDMAKAESTVSAPVAKVEAAPMGSARAAKAGHAPRLSARERLLAAADELFYENGINTVGIDRII